LAPLCGLGRQTIEANQWPMGENNSYGRSAGLHQAARLIGVSASALRAVLEAPAFVAGLADIAMMRQPVEPRELLPF